MSGNRLQQAGPNAPAFPQSFDFIGPTWNPITDRALAQGQRERQIFMGVTRREYFMARAPYPVPEWFYPVMRPCPLVPSIDGVTDPSLRAGIEAYWDSATDDPEAAAWVKASIEAEKAQEAWQIEFRMEVMLQWPGAWADEMLKRSGA